MIDVKLVVPTTYINVNPQIRRITVGGASEGEGVHAGSKSSTHPGIRANCIVLDGASTNATW